MASKDLVFRFLGMDAGAGREFDRMAGKSAALEHAVGKLTLGFAAAGVAMGVESVRAAAKFQTAMELIHTQAGRSQKTVDRMSKAVLAMSGPVATGPDELAKGLYHLASTGLSAAKTMQALKIAAEGAKLGGANLEDVTNALNATIVSGIKGSKDFTSAMGMLNATVGAGDMRMQDLAEAMGTGVLTTAKNFGVSLNSVGAALAVFGDNNIRGADAATKLQQAMTYMEKPAAGANKVLKTIGLSSKQLRSDMGSGGLGKTLADLHDHLVKAGDTGTKLGPILLDIFGRKPANAINTLLGQYQRFQTKQEDVRKGSKNFASDWTSYTTTFGYSWDRAKSAFESMSIEIGQKLLPTATHAMKWIGTTGVGDLEKFSGWIGRNKTPIEDIAKVLAAIAAFRFASSKLNDISRLLGFGSKGLGGAGGGILGSAKPIPVYVTNMGAGGFGVGGKGVSGAERAGEGAAAEGVGARIAAKVGLQGASRLAGPLYATYLATQGGDQNPAMRNAVTGRNASQQLADLIRSIVVRPGFDLAKASGAEKSAYSAAFHGGGGQTGVDTGAAVAFIQRYGSPAQLSALQKLAGAITGVGKSSVSSAAMAKAAADREESAWGGASRALATQQQRTNNQILGSLRKIPGAMRQIAAEANAAGLTIGEQLDAGITVGIRQGKGNIDIVSTAVIDGIRSTMSKHAKITSPSKMTAYIGRMLAEGLGVGMEQGGRVAVSKAQNLLDGVLGKLGAARGNASGLAGGIAGNLTGGASLSNMPLASLTTAFGTSYTAAPTTAGMTAYLSSYLGRERAFARNLGVARKKGLSPVDAGNIAQLGLDVGGPIAAALAGSSTAQVRHVSALDAQISSTANALGSSIAQGQYGAEIARLLREQNGLLAALAHKTGVEVANAMKSPHSARTLATSHTRAQRSK